ncbi:MAG: hypothetical protein A2286_08155 [Gammaproteobacteria bacterium RIFOXYA12_FULL_61_12]|nr:MAG: hypothetical protein A2286_08155 [Gammaproteobacteria bacterium RIFOXYA12_FULL_61_12]
MTLELEECKRSPSINITSITVTEDIKKDPRDSAVFIIDVDDMTAFNKVIKDASIGLTNGILTTIKYDAEDQTAEIIKEGAKLATGLPLSFGVRETGRTMLAEDTGFCNEATVKALLDRNNADSKKQLTITVTAKTIPLSLDHSERIHFDFAPSLKWFKLSNIGDGSTLLKELDKFSIKVSGCHSDGMNYQNDTEPGLYYREPNDCLVELYLGSRAIMADTYEVPQFGALARLEIENKAFQTNTHDISFNSNGGISKFQVKETGESRGLTALSTANAMQTEVIDHQKEILEHQTNLLRAQQDLIEAQQSASGR